MSEHLDPWEEKIKSKLEGFRSPAEVSDDKVNAFFQQNVADAPEEKQSSFPFLKIAAAVLLLLVASTVIYQFNSVTHQTGVGQASEIVLPDGSKVNLRYETTLAYNRVGWYLGRNVKLDGEAYFQVAKGSTFRVDSKAGSTEVLGTIFNVLASRGIYEVKCFEGKVKVKYGTNDTDLTAGQAITFVDDQVKPYQFDHEAPNWPQGEIHFENEDLYIVMAELSRTYDISVKIPEELHRMKYTGFFPTNDLEMALKLVLDPLGLKANSGEEKSISISKIQN